MDYINFKELNALKNKLELAKKQEYVMQLPFWDILRNSYPAGVEHLVRHELNDAWDDYSFLIRKVFYRINNYIILLQKLLDPLEELLNSLDGSKSIFALGIGKYQTDKLSYEFEDMIIAFSKLYEEAIVSETSRYLPPKFASEFRKNCPKKNDVNGLYWRINLLRNRVAHSTSGKYFQKDGQSSRYETFSSKTHMLQVDLTSPIPIKITCNLIDTENNPNIRRFIQNEIISKHQENSSSNGNVFDMLFPENNPKGHNKRHPSICSLVGLNQFDYYSGFLSLSNQILDFCQSQIAVFLKSALEKCDDSIFQQNTLYSEAEKYSEKEQLKIRDVFEI